MRDLAGRRGGPRRAAADHGEAGELGVSTSSVRSEDPGRALPTVRDRIERLGARPKRSGRRALAAAGGARSRPVDAAALRGEPRLFVDFSGAPIPARLSVRSCALLVGRGGWRMQTRLARRPVTPVSIQPATLRTGTAVAASPRSRSHDLRSDTLASTTAHTGQARTTMSCEIQRSDERTPGGLRGREGPRLFTRPPLRLRDIRGLRVYKAHNGSAAFRLTSTSSGSSTSCKSCMTCRSRGRSSGRHLRDRARQQLGDATCAVDTAGWGARHDPFAAPSTS